MEKGLLEKTGKDLAHWKKVVETSGLTKHSEIIAYLKKEHAFTHGFANFVAMKARKADAASHDPNELVHLQYSKGKEGLKPIYDLLLEKINGLGEGIEVVPKKANVSIKTKKQFALIHPKTKSRIDIGLKLKGKETTDRLMNSGHFGSMCTHRVEVFSLTDVDDELMDWLQEAYEKSF